MVLLPSWYVLLRRFSGSGTDSGILRNFFVNPLYCLSFFSTDSHTLTTDLLEARRQRGMLISVYFDCRELDTNFSFRVSRRNSKQSVPALQGSFSLLPGRPLPYTNSGIDIRVYLSLVRFGLLCYFVSFFRFSRCKLPPFHHPHFLLLGF